MTRPPSDPELHLIRDAIARMRAGAMAVVFAMVGGTGLFLATAVLLLRGGPEVGRTLGLLGHYLPGYSVTWPGSLAGFFWGAVVGAVAGWSLALVYNRVAEWDDPEAEIAEAPLFTVVVPVRDGGPAFPRVLRALLESAGPSLDVVVVDDGSQDDSAEVARELGCTVLACGGKGPAAARNLGAAHARGEWLLFLDADCEVHADTLARAAAAMVAAEPGVDAFFGSYDAEPAAPGLVSRWRNILHHWVHQRGGREASTFWAGCGAVRRAAFERVGGFDAERIPGPTMEDVDLGVRLRASGSRIRLEPGILVKHHKRWSLGGMVRTDVLQRAVPWTRIALATGRLPSDLNADWRGRLGVAGTLLAALALAGSPWLPWLALVALLLLAGVAFLHRDFYRVLHRRGGLPLAAAGVPLHALHFLSAAAGFVLGVARHVAERPGAARAAWAGVAAALALFAAFYPAHLIQTPGDITGGPRLARAALALSAAAALAWAFLGVGRLRLRPADRLPLPPPLGRDLAHPGRWLLGLTAAALALRLPGLDMQLWHDEIQTVLDHATRPALLVVFDHGGLNNHVLHSLLVRAAIGVLGPDEWVVRVPALLLGVALVPAIYLLARLTLRSREALLAAAVVAASYHMVWFSQNARGYTGLLLATALSTVFLVRALAGDRARDWIAVALFTFLGSMTVAQALLGAVGQAAVLPIAGWRARAAGGRFWPGPLKGALALGAGALGALDLLAGGLVWLVRRFSPSRGTWDVPIEEPSGFWYETARGLRDGFGDAGLLAALVLALAMAPGLGRFLRRDPFLAALLAAPLLGPTLYGLNNGYVVPRFFLWVIPAGAVALVAATAALPRVARIAPVVAAAVVVAASLATLPAAWRVPKQPTRTSLEWLLAASEPGDVVVALRQGGQGLRYYGPRTGLSATRRTGVVWRIGRFRAVERAAGDRTLWVITTHTLALNEEAPALAGYLQRRYRPAAVFPASVSRLDITVWRAPPPP